MNDIETLTEFAQIRGKYQQLATKRLDERKNSGHLDGDYFTWVTEEMLIDVLNRLNKIEAFLDLKPKE